MKNSFDPYNHFGFLTNRVGRLINNSVNPKLKAKGYEIPASCIGILAELWVKDGMTQKELGFSTIKTKSSVNKMLKSMMEAELIIKKSDDQDKRTNRIFLTQKGKELKKEVNTMGLKIEQALLIDHSPKEIETAKNVLATLYQKLLESA